MNWNTKIEDIELSKSPFSADVIIKIYDHQVESYEKKLGTVDLARVVGSTHPSYGGKCWDELKPVPGTLHGDFVNNNAVAFQGLERAISNVQELDKNPEYYLSKEEKSQWSYYLIDDNYYISSGNNRTIIARYFLYLNQLPQIVHGVKITRGNFKKGQKSCSMDQKQPSLMQKLISLIKT